MSADPLSSSDNQKTPTLCQRETGAFGPKPAKMLKIRLDRGEASIYVSFVFWVSVLICFELRGLLAERFFLMIKLLLLFVVTAFMWLPRPGWAIDFTSIELYRGASAELFQKCRKKAEEIEVPVTLSEATFLVAIFYEGLISIGFQSGRSGIVGIRDEDYRQIMFCEAGAESLELLSLGVRAPYWLANGYSQQPAGIGKVAFVFTISDEVINLVAIVDPSIL